MIADDVEYRVTLDAAARLAAALEEADTEAAEPDPRHQRLMRAALASQLHDLRAEFAEYQARAGRRRAAR